MLREELLPWERWFKTFWVVLQRILCLEQSVNTEGWIQFRWAGRTDGLAVVGRWLVTVLTQRMEVGEAHWGGQQVDSWCVLQLQQCCSLLQKLISYRLSLKKTTTKHCGLSGINKLNRGGLSAKIGRLQNVQLKVFPFKEAGDWLLLLCLPRQRFNTPLVFYPRIYSCKPACPCLTSQTFVHLNPTE